MRVHIWSSVELSLKTARVSNLASLRMRIAPLLVALEKMGVQWTSGPLLDKSPDVFFIGKIGVRALDEYSSSLAKSIQDNALICCDYTDDVISMGGTHHRRSLYKSLLDEQRCRFTVPSKLIASSLILRSISEERINVIPDLVEFSRIAPKTHKVCAEGFRWLWFGHPSNMQALIDWLESSEFALDEASQIIIVSDQTGFEILKAHNFTRKPKIVPYLQEWTPTILRALARNVDFAVIPSRKFGASNNRLLTALALGLPVIAEPLDSYAEYADFFVPITDSERIQNLINDKQKESEIVERFQMTELQAFQKDRIEDIWYSFFQGLRAEINVN